MRVYEPGTHVCLIYDNEAERRDVVAQFVEEGLASGERVAYFTDGEPEALVRVAHRQGPHAARAAPVLDASRARRLLP